jgi:hypothetical protein
MHLSLIVSNIGLANSVGLRIFQFLWDLINKHLVSQTQIVIQTYNVYLAFAAVSVTVRLVLVRHIIATILKGV